MKNRVNPFGESPCLKISNTLDLLFLHFYCSKKSLDNKKRQGLILPANGEQEGQIQPIPEDL